MQSARLVCPLGHKTRPGQTRCPVCGEATIADRRKQRRPSDAEHDDAAIHDSTPGATPVEPD